MKLAYVIFFKLSMGIKFFSLQHITLIFQRNYLLINKNLYLLYFLNILLFVRLKIELVFVPLSIIKHFKLFELLKISLIWSLKILLLKIKFTSLNLK